MSGDGREEFVRFGVVDEDQSEVVVFAAEQPVQMCADKVLKKRVADPF